MPAKGTNIYTLEKLQRHASGTKRIEQYLYKAAIWAPEGMTLNVKLDEYSKKLLELAENYFLVHGHEDIGMLSFYANDKRSHTSHLTVLSIRPDHQGKGLGQMLLQQAEKEAKSKGMCTMHFPVYIKNVKAINFYQKHNYAIIDTTPATYIMEKAL